MSKILYLQASPRGDQSHSVAVAEAFMESYKAAHAGDIILKKNLFTMDLPPFDGAAMQGKYAILHGRPHTAEESRAWERVVAVIEEFKSADKYVLAVPMWNFHLPYRLKHYIDVIVQPTYTFSYSPSSGYAGLVTGKKAFIAYARGGEYPPGTPGEAYDFQTRYLESILGFMGITDIQRLIVEPTLMLGPEEAGHRRGIAVEKARDLARKF